MVTHLKRLNTKLKRERFGRSAERSRRMLDQLELQQEDLEASAAAETAAARAAKDSGTGESRVNSFYRRRPVRAPLAAHLPRERVVAPGAVGVSMLRRQAA